ncbi:DNA-binding transcriptional regulator, LysR family [Haloechinothrix alba]|uniref:DNA-binding transcriptional regulator, LysR family n=1 Tax=Haloechinothrix alba TaxID=664784 RepID=A0A239ABJ4_9PSEU|nr:LysR family transcriptional regulator [Haloechinothrix alba]SNR93036.1 DNA-binding transcriptional regulator, LysR family [Haloechinothrix alba]
MDIPKLRTLREFADRGSVTAVAEALHCTPSAVSQQLRALQAEVGVPLTEPAGRGMRLTDAGRALVARADEVLAALERAESDVDTYRSAPRGRVRVALFPSAALMLLPGFLHRVAEVTDLEVESSGVELTPGEVPGLLADFDIVLTHRDEHAEALDSPSGAAGEDASRLRVVHLLREPFDIALPHGHRLGAKHKVELADLAHERWISVDVGFPADDVLRSVAIRTGMHPYVVQRINDFRVIEALVAAGHGVALLPRYSMAARGGRLVRRPLAGIRAARHIEAVLRAGGPTRPAVSAVLDMLSAEATAVTSTPGAE